MADLDGNYADFMEAVVPDVNKELDRICMACLEMDLQRMPREAGGDKTKYNASVEDLTSYLYRSESSDSDDDRAPLYPAVHLCYWVEVRADHWRKVRPPPATPRTSNELEALLAAARRIQVILDESPQSSDKGSSDTGGGDETSTVDLGPSGNDLVTPRDTTVAKLTIDAVLAWHEASKKKPKRPNKKDKPGKSAAAAVTAKPAKRAGTRKAAKPSTRGKGAGNKRRTKATKPANAAGAATS